jgi:hypothetical protein
VPGLNQRQLMKLPSAAPEQRQRFEWEKQIVKSQ